MRTRVILAIRRFVINLLLLVIVSCDSFKEDFIQPENQVTFSQTEYYILPGSSIIIDQKSLIKESFSNVTLSVTQNPKRGELSPLDTLLLKYQPGPDFTEGKDQFVFSVLSDGSVLKTETMTIFIKRHQDEFPCAVYTVEDRVRVKAGALIAIRVLENDRICGPNNSSPQVSIYSKPRYGEGRLEGDSVIVYTPGAAFQGSDEMIYKLTASPGGIITYGIVTITNGAIQTLAIPEGVRNKYWGTRKLLFIDENSGFLLADSLYKTTDGGESWSMAQYPQYERQLIADIFFLDANNGFLAYNAGPLMRTSDGGITWKHIEKQSTFSGTNSIYFTSLSTGFMITNRMTVPWDSIQHHVYRTEDGGVNWKEVFTTPDEIDGVLEMAFANPTTGYMYKRDKVFVTTDAGISWKLLFKHDYITFLKITPENEIFGIFGVGSSTVYESHDGVIWSQVSTLRFPDSRLEFSPSGGVWFSAGVNYDPSVAISSQILSMTKSINNGETWVKINLGESSHGYPLRIAIPSSDVVYILCTDKIIKYIP